MTKAEYIAAVLSALRRLTPEERTSVQAELDGHIEDHMADLLALDYPRDLAEERALSAMGDPEAVGRELEKQYPLRWLILGRAAVVLTVALCVQMVLGVGILGMVLDSFAARIYPDEDTRLNTVAAQERVDVRLPVGGDVLRIYRVAVGQRGNEIGLWEAEVSMCAYDRIPGGTVSNVIWSHTEVANPRGETVFSGSGRGNWWVEYQRQYAALEPGDTYVTLTYDYLGERRSVELPLPEGGIPS